MVTTNTHVYFFSGATIFSNFHETPRQFSDPVNNGMTFNSTEQAFMWWKAVFFQDLKIATLLEQETVPANAKSLGRQIKGYSDPAWSCVREGFMTYVNLLKYSQNPDFLNILKLTGNRILVEASPYDKIWGIGLAENDPLIFDEKNWKGLNLLGKSLMTVRGML